MKETLAILALMLAGTSCEGLSPRACTLIGCGGLVIEVSNAPAQTPVSAVLTAPDGSTRNATATCASTCWFSFPDFTPATLTVRITAGDKSSEVTATPSYEVSRPNGAGCPPECRSARVSIALP